MRIIGGEYRSKRFNPPKNNPARPTTDIAKEGLFNVLNNYYYFEDVKFLDLFAGTGSISYEMSSRGCEDITCVEKFGPNVKFIQQTSKEIKADFNVYKKDVFRFMDNCNEKFNLIFAGPPYPLKTLATLPDLVFKNNLLAKEGWFILEHNPNHNFKDDERLKMVKNYGTTIFSIFSN